MSTKFARTTITLSDGCIQTARLNLHTGEVKAYKYKMLSEGFKKLEHNGSVSDPFWFKYLNVEKDKTNLKDGKTVAVRKSKDNPNNIFLESYMELSDAVEDMPVLDNLVTGVSNIDCGNNQPIPQGLLFSMLRDLDSININTIKEYTGYSDKYCYRLAQYLRILSVAFDREVDK